MVSSVRQDVAARYVVVIHARRRDTVLGVDVEVGERGIRLGQLLKLTDVVDTGGAARALLDAGEVTVNGAVESRRGRQLAAGDLVRCRGQEMRVV